jgi:filamentous hemagglutinin family protein
MNQHLPTVLLITLVSGGFLETALAQVPNNILPDRTLGAENSIITDEIPRTTRITGGATRGSNLFHSFQNFSIATNQTARFDNGAAIRNILVRVTGSNLSNIDGTLRANGTANLFLLNPNGILWGRNARLDLRGSFMGTTAHSVNFSDGSQFSTIAPQSPSLLAINLPTGLQFGDRSGSISILGDGRGLRRSEDPIITPNQAALRVPSNQTLAFVGGALLIEGGTLKTAGGRIELGAVALAGNVGLTQIASGFALNYADIKNFGDLRLTRAASVDASGANGGSIQIQGKVIILQDGTQIETTTIETGTSGSLRINASDRVELSGSTADNPGDNRRFPTAISSDNREAGQVPNQLIIGTKALTIRNGARISASTAKDGIGGNIIVNAAAVELSGTGISQGGVRSSAISVQTRGKGNAGELTINTQRLLLQNGAEVSASTFGAGAGGTITVNASEQVELRGTNGALRSGLVAGVGNPGDVLRAGSSSPPETAIGQGGDLTITTPRLLVNDQATITVSSRNPQAKGAGRLEINAQSIQLDKQGSITAESLSGQGGDIILNMTRLRSPSPGVLLLRNGSKISATAGNARNPGNGGNVNITVPFIVVIPIENSDITSNAFSGDGGRITIQAENLFGIQFRAKPTALSDITASSERGNQGIVTLNTPDIDPSRGLIVLPSGPIDVSQKIDRTCNPNSNVSSSFVTRGNGGLPATPQTDRFLSLPARLASLPTASLTPKNTTFSKESSPIREAQGIQRLADGKIRLVVDEKRGAVMIGSDQNCR